MRRRVDFRKISPPALLHSTYNHAERCDISDEELQLLREHDIVLARRLDDLKKNKDNILAGSLQIDCA